LVCAIMWAHEVLCAVVNPPRIDGKDGVAGSIPAGRSTTKRQARPGLVPGLLHARRGPNPCRRYERFRMDRWLQRYACSLPPPVSATSRSDLLIRPDNGDDKGCTGDDARAHVPDAFGNGKEEAAEEDANVPDTLNGWGLGMPLGSLAVGAVTSRSMLAARISSLTRSPRMGAGHGGEDGGYDAPNGSHARPTLGCSPPSSSEVGRSFSFSAASS
jgi:hypothetical protein